MHQNDVQGPATDCADAGAVMGHVVVGRMGIMESIEHRRRRHQADAEHHSMEAANIARLQGKLEANAGLVDALEALRAFDII